MGITKKPSQKHYWSQDPIFRHSLIPKIMTRDRFMAISQHLHFADNDENAGNEKLYKIQALWDLCNNNFSRLLVPNKNLCIDESLVSHKGRLSFKQFIPSKRSRFGIKCYLLVDSETGFILCSKIYCGRGMKLKYPVKDYGYGGAIVLELMEPYYNKNHHVYMDNFFSSPILARSLLEKGTYMCGTLRKGRKNAPVPPRKIPRGDVEFFSSNNVMCEFWSDKKIVRMISSLHQHSIVDKVKKGRVMRKPQTVWDYNLQARGIDQADMQMHFDSVKRKTRMWYRKLFFHLIDMCLFNAFRIWKSLNENAKFLEFKLAIIKEITEKYGILENGLSVPDDFDRLKARHFPNYNPGTKGKLHGARACHVCKKSTRYRCVKCSVSLCVIPCFETYHCKRKYK